MAGPDTIDLSGAVRGGPRANTRQGQDVQRQENVIQTEHLPTQYAQEGEKHGQTIKQNNEQAIAGLRKEFRSSQPYLKYEDVMTALGSAIDAAEQGNSQGDIDLIYAAAKIFDPGSVVREGEQAMISHTQSGIEAAKGDVYHFLGIDRGTKLDAPARILLMKELYSRAKAHNTSYNRVRKDFIENAKAGGYDPDRVVGTHIGQPYFKQADTYAKKNFGPPPEAAEEQDPTKARVGLLDTPPTGMQITGEPIESEHLSRPSELALTNFVRGPDFTPEAYGQLAADKMVEEGIITPEQRDATAAATAAEAASRFGELTPEQRQQVPSKIDYGGADEAALMNASVPELLASGIKNAPSSLVGAAANLVQLPGDAIMSGLRSWEEGKPTAVGGVKGLLDVGADLFGADNGATANMLQTLGDEYLTEEGWRRRISQDPVGIASDVVGGVGTVGKAGKLARATDLATIAAPLTAARRGLEWTGDKLGQVKGYIPQAARESLSRMGDIPNNVERHLSGMLPGTGGDAISEAYAAGRTRPFGSPNTPRSEAFLSHGRGEGDYDALIADARKGLTNMRDARSAQYRTDIATLGQNPTPLDFGKVEQMVTDMKPKSYDAHVGDPDNLRPSDHKAWDRVNAKVQSYRQQATANPDLLLPENMDQFKRDLYDVTLDLSSGSYNRTSARVATKVRDSVWNLISDHDPTYAKTMKDYAEASNKIDQIETTFGLSAGAGKPVNIDKATRRLQSIFRNNAYTNYGQRTGLAGDLVGANPDSLVMPRLAGDTLSAAKPRGLQPITSTMASLGMGFAPALLGANPMVGIPLAVATGIASSPRAVGGLAFNAGRLGATGEKLGDFAGKYGAKIVNPIADLAEKYPTAAAGTIAAGRTFEEMERQQVEEERMRQLAERYGIQMPGMGL